MGFIASSMGYVTLMSNKDSMFVHYSFPLRVDSDGMQNLLKRKNNYTVRLWTPPPPTTTTTDRTRCTTPSSLAFGITSINSVMLSPNLVSVILEIQIALRHSQGEPMDSDKTYIYVII